MEVRQAEDEERDRQEDREVGGLPGRGVVGGLLVLEGMEQVPDGERDATGEQRDALPVTASAGGVGGDRVSTGAVGWSWTWVMAASPAWRVGYGVSAYMRVHRIRCQVQCAHALPAPDETERQILDAVAEIIATEDFDAVSMRRVAAKAKVSLSTVVRHFGTKDALLAALVGQGGEDEERDALRRSMEPGDVAAAVRVVVRDYEEAGAAADAHAGPGAPLPRAVGAARPRPTRPPHVGAVGVRSPARGPHAPPGRPSSRTCWSSPPTSTRGSSSASTVGSARERPRSAMTELCEAVVAR